MVMRFVSLKFPPRLSYKPLFSWSAFILCDSRFSEWYSVLNRVQRASESELKEMKEESANIKNAVVCFVKSTYCCA